MKDRALRLLFSLSPLLLFSQNPQLPDSLIHEPWYYGSVFNTPAFLYIDKENRETGYFFAANSATPAVYPLSIKWKKDNPKAASFVRNGKKIKAKFIGQYDKDTISGFILTNRKNAIHLGIIPEIRLFMVRESILIPSAPPHRSDRYHEQVFPLINIERDISYGAATGYYTSMPVNDDSYDYQQIILDALGRM